MSRRYGTGPGGRGATPIEAEPPRESQIQAEIVAALEQIGCFVYVNHANRERSLAGMSDLIVLIRGRGLHQSQTVFMEVKRPGGAVRIGQVKFQRDVAEYGCTYVVVRSRDEAVDFMNMKLWDILSTKRRAGK